MLMLRRNSVVAIILPILLGSCLSSSAQSRARTYAAQPKGGNAPTQSVLYSFCGQGGQLCTDGVYPMGQLAQGIDGNFYGVTEDGGSNGEAYGGFGTAFKLTPSGTLTTIYDFCALSDCTDGINPQAGLIVGGDGNFYGVTTGGGANDGFGTVFQLTPAGTLTVLYTFQNTTDGAYPSGPLALGSDGNFYGTTTSGGASGPGGSGTVFQLTPAGSIKTLYNFCSATNCTDGATPEGGLLQGSDGYFYGTTAGGGSDSSGCFGFGCGTIYRVTMAGALATLYSFQDGADGASPEAGLVQGSGGFYGVTFTGGTPSDGCGGYGCGTVFEFVPLGAGGTLTTIYSFGGAADGGESESRLVLASDGNLYGTTNYYTVGTDDNTGGTVFQVTPTGGLTTLYTFCSLTDCADGEQPADGVTQGNDGNFYGVTLYGGANEESAGGAGTAYKVGFATPLAAPIQLSVYGQPYQNQPTTVYFNVANAYSLSSQQCYAFATDETASETYALGKVTGTLKGSVFSGSFTVTPPTAATYVGALTCGGTETGFISGAVMATHATATVLTAAPNPVYAGGSEQLTATVTRTDSSGTPTGSVTFYVGTYVLGTASVNGSGVATLSANASIAPYGSYAINAVYGGDTQDGASTSNTVTVVSEKGVTSTMLTASPNPVTEGQPVTLTAVVSTNGGTIIGSVGFYSGSVYLGTGNISGGTAHFVASSAGIPPGNYPVTATYSGSNGQSVSTSSPVTVTVNPAP